ncbi:hypothetical protein F2Q70_00039014 [Brassica cretica]|uniref:Uncharacterized protein n=1 Tax=Brassica cretica TaxID=69181 RepID=A0A8S9KBW7_BRACR|nr:hypothetical protein F2Q70_00039014 [Brassica cretica]
MAMARGKMLQLEESPAEKGKGGDVLTGDEEKSATGVASTTKEPEANKAVRGETSEPCVPKKRKGSSEVSNRKEQLAHEKVGVFLVSRADATTFPRGGRGEATVDGDGAWEDVTARAKSR